MITSSSRIWCDVQGCGAIQTLANVDRTEAVREAKKLGWSWQFDVSAERFYHFCPRHQP